MEHSSGSSPARSRLWTVLSLGFGAVVPVVVWTFVFVMCGLQLGLTQFGLILVISYLVVIVNVGTLVLWHCGNHSSAALEHAASAIFCVGASFAFLWSCFAVFNVLMLMRELSVWLGLMSASPFPCVIVYGVNASKATALARELRANRTWHARTTRTATSNLPQ
jgi:hypothetical protein